MGKLTNLAQMKLAALRAQQEISEVAAAAIAAAGAEYVTLTIPVASWASNTDSTLAGEGYAYMADVSVGGLTAADGAISEIAIASRAAAETCGLAGIAQTIAGAIRYYAREKPSASLALQVQIMRATEGT